MSPVAAHDDSASPAFAWRTGLRGNAWAMAEPEAEGPARVLRVDPRDGAAGVFRDSPVIVRLSQAADPASLSPATFRVEGPFGPVPGHAGLSPDGQCLIWTAEEPFAPDALHFVVVRGLADQRGREIQPHVTRFVSCDIVWSTLPI
jgi:hypothetical protein